MKTRSENQFRFVNCRWNSPQFRSRMNEVINVGKESFSYSAVLDNSLQLDESDVALARLFLCQAAPTLEKWPETGSNWNHPKGPAEHIVLCGVVAREISKSIIELDPSISVSPAKMEVVGLLHDLGRLVSHEFFITDMLSDVLARHIGISSSISSSFHKIDWYWNVEKKLCFEEITPEQRVSVISDVLSKRHSQNPQRMRRASEVVSEVQVGKQKYLSKSPQSQADFIMHRIIEDYSYRESFVLSNVLRWLSNIGVNLDEVIEEIEEKNPFVQA